VKAVLGSGPKAYPSRPYSKQHCAPELSRKPPFWRSGFKLVSLIRVR